MAPTIDEKWTWVSMLDRLTGGDLTKLDQIYERNWIECLNFMSFWMVRDEYMEQVNRIEQQKYR